MNELPRDWDEWAKKYGPIVLSQRAKGSLVSYEWEFAKTVLRHVSGLPASRVIPQQPFVGENGQTLHVDFGIEVNGHKIAVEVEGFDKTGSGMGKTMKEHNNWAARQRALETLGWKVIAITNKDFLTNPVKYQRIIENAMTSPAKVEQVVLTPQPVVVKVQYQKAKTEPVPAVLAEKSRGSSSGSILAITAVVVLGIAAFTFAFANTNSIQGPTFSDPSNPDCPEFDTRAQLIRWANANPEIVSIAKLDGDRDGLICESFKYPDD